MQLQVRFIFHPSIFYLITTFLTGGFPVGKEGRDRVTILRLLLVLLLLLRRGSVCLRLIEAIPQNGTTQLSQMQANLMRSACQRLTFHKGSLLMSCEDSHPGSRGLAALLWTVTAT